MNAVKELAFGTVVRRGRDSMTVMVLGVVNDSLSMPIDTDEIGVNPGGMIGFVLDRGSADVGADYPYWPLLGTCSITELQDLHSSAEWEILS